MGLVAVMVMLGGGRALGFIQRLTPLQSVILDSDAVFLARVDRLDPKRPSVVLTVERELKGKLSARRLAINLAGDKEGHSGPMLKRLADGLPVVVFVTELDEKQLALGYTNGTWFQVIGTRDGGGAVRWAFTHCEIYLRRTFKGTTDELRRTVEDALAGRSKPPKPDPKEPPGLGPVLASVTK